MTAGTIEEKIYHRQIYKQFLTSQVLLRGGSGAASSKRFFDSNSLRDLFVLEPEDGSSSSSSRCGGGGGAKSMATETGRIFKGAETIMKREPKSRKREGKAGESDKLESITGIRDVAEFKSDAERREEETGHLSGSEDEDTRLLSSLLHSSVAHDKVLAAAGASGVDANVEREARRVAEEAAEEVRKSRRRVRAEMKRSEEGVASVTWTGLHGSAGASSGLSGVGIGNSSSSVGGGGGRGGLGSHSGGRFGTRTVGLSSSSGSLLAGLRGRNMQ